MAARLKGVCVPCRKVYGGGGSSNRSGTRDSRGSKVATVAPLRCTHCGRDLVWVSYRWRAPRRNSDRAWRRIEAGHWLWEHDPKEVRRGLSRYSVPVRKRRGKLLPRFR